MTELRLRNTVMLVDDSPANLRLLSEILESEGFEVLAFLRGAPAIEAVRVEQPELILLDINMPEMDGFELCKRLKEKEALRDVPVIFISASMEMDDKIRAFEAGGVDYVTKPFHREEVLARVGVHLELRHALTQLEERNADLQTTLERLKLTQSQLVQSEKLASVGMLAAGVAHEINNPINFINSSAITVQRKANDLMAHATKCRDLLSDQPEQPVDNSVQLERACSCVKLGKGLPELTANIVDGAKRVTEIVKGLRLFSRVDKSTQEMADIHEGLESTLVLLRNRTKDAILVERDYEALPRIVCFPGKLNQVFMNLFVNALDALERENKPDARIVVRTRAEENDGKWISISIIDNGPGISKEVIGSLFEPFTTTKPVGEGTGLGLSISHGIVNEHGGKIAATNEPAGGARFTVLLPVRELPESGQPESRSST